MGKYSMLKPTNSTGQASVACRWSYVRPNILGSQQWIAAKNPNPMPPKIT